MFEEEFDQRIRELTTDALGDLPLLTGTSLSEQPELLSLAEDVTRRIMAFHQSDPEIAWLEVKDLLKPERSNSLRAFLKCLKANFRLEGGYSTGIYHRFEHFNEALRFSGSSIADTKERLKPYAEQKRVMVFEGVHTSGVRRSQGRIKKESDDKGY